MCRPSIMETVVVSVLRLVLMMFIISSSAGSRWASASIPSASSLAHQHCPSSCGDLNIPYPFGIGPGCFHRGFELTSDHTAHPPKLFLGNSTTTQITSPLYSSGLYTTALGFNVTMSHGVDTYNVSWQPPDEGVIITHDNTLYVVGCNVDVILFGDNMTDLIGSCMSVCTDDREAMERVNFDGSCDYGLGCCAIWLPWDLPAFMLQLVLGELYMSWVNISNVKMHGYQGPTRL